MTAAGDLRFKVRFDKKALTAGEGGGAQTTWQPQFTCRAEIRPLRGGEEVQQQRLQGLQPVLIVVRRSLEARQVTPAWRAVELGAGDIEVAEYGLKTAQDMERKGAFITFLAVAGDADGR